MNDLVFLKGDDVFTDSLVIASGTGIEHPTVTKTLKRYRKDFEEFGDLRFSDSVSKNPKGGRPSRIYLLNEQQATLLITYLGNSEVVRAFKIQLVKQFYKMRQFILERQSTIWKDTREYGKVTRKAETDILKKLVEYAREQGSEHADMYYVTYSRLANKAVGIKNRDEATVQQLNNLSLAENVILRVIDMGIATNKHYKTIYKECKIRLEAIADLAYLTA